MVDGTKSRRVKGISIGGGVSGGRWWSGGCHFGRERGGGAGGWAVSMVREGEGNC